MGLTGCKTQRSECWEVARARRDGALNRRTVLSAFALVAGCGPRDAPRDAERATVVARATGSSASAAAAARVKIARVATLSFGTRTTTAISNLPPQGVVRARLAELGHIEGQTIVIEDHFAQGDPERLERMARDIVADKPDVIVAFAAAATLAARRATSTIPIVMAHTGDPVGAGLATTLARPGGNVTGTTSMVPDLGAKQVEYLRQLIPRLRRLAVLFNPTNPGHILQLANLKEAASHFGIDVFAAEVGRAEDFDGALRRLHDARTDALFVMIEPMTYLHRSKVLELAERSKWPTSFDVGREIVREGGLMSFGPVLSTHYPLVAEYVDKVLKGAKPGDLPIQQPTDFGLVVNLKTAKAIGLTVPQSMLLRADEVIQ